MSSRRSGVTLHEMLIAIATIGLLMAILIPAVQHAREASRRTQCRSHLREIGIAIQNYESNRQMFPPGSANSHSLHVFLLPYLEESALAATVDFENAGDVTGNGVLETSAVSAYFCPSDPMSDVRLGEGAFATNYAGNFGSGVQRYGYNGFFRPLAMQLMFGRGGPIRDGDIRDGLSNTSAVAEILVSDGNYGRLRTILPVVPPLPGADQLDEFALRCDALPQGTTGDTWFRGRPWNLGDAGSTLYNHVLPPNRNSCKNDAVGDGAYTAASAHPGGVHTLFGDGHVQFVADAIDRGVWTAIGSRDAGEMISLQ